MVILCIIIGDVHQFIRHCLIPLDPCSKLLIKTIISALAGGSALKEVDKIESELEVVDIDAIQVHPQ